MYYLGARARSGGPLKFVKFRFTVLTQGALHVFIVPKSWVLHLPSAVLKSWTPRYPLKSLSK